MKQIIKSTINNIYAFLIVFLAVGFIPVENTYAVAVIADSPCDELYYETLSARAWLEAQREISQNQNLILKPDSVFEYSCFDRLAHELAKHAEDMLSETTNFGTGTSLGTTSMDTVLDDLVLEALEAYQDSNYSHSALGGHTAGLAIDHDIIQTGGSPTAYTCDMMAKVWNAAKCINFISNSTTDGFFTFDEYASAASLGALAVDVRHLPTMCSVIPTSWTANVANALTSGPWTNDDVVTYLDQTKPQDCTGTTCLCDGDPIPTGISVERNGYPINKYQEHICLQPGCYYEPTSATAGGCQAYSP